MDFSSLLEEAKEFCKKQISPELEYKCLIRYLASESDEKFLKPSEILDLINSHGIELRNDISYWFDQNNFEVEKEDSESIPVLQPQHLICEKVCDLTKRLQELPSEWTIIQITKKFSVDDILKTEFEQKLSGIHVIRMQCGALADKIQPYGITVNETEDCSENIFKNLKNLVKLRSEFYTQKRISKQSKQSYLNTNSELTSFIKELESYILKECLCLFRGRLEDTELESETLSQVRHLVNLFNEKEGKPNISETELDLVYQITLSAHLLKQRSIFSVLHWLFYGQEQLNNYSELLLFIDNLKFINLKKNYCLKRAKCHPIILILDNEFEMVPWEMISPLHGQQVIRISSFNLLYAMYKYHQPHIRNGFRTIQIDSIYCLINPSKDLENCEKEMSEFLKKNMPWAEVEVRKVPQPEDIISRFENTSGYLYCGHGTGMQYLDEKELKKAFVKGLIFLFGCSSNIPRNAGGKTPCQNNTYTYINNGCPCVIGCIQDISSADADLACKEILSSVMPMITTSDNMRVVNEPKEPNVLKALIAGKSVCSKYWSESAFVARGIPCKTTLGDCKKLIIVRFT